MESEDGVLFVKVSFYKADLQLQKLHANQVFVLTVLFSSRI
jgi:hypothetical protein